MLPQIGFVAGIGAAAGGSRVVMAALAGSQTAGNQYAETYADLRDEQGVSHEQAWARVAPYAAASGIVTGLTTFLGGASGVEALARPAGQATLREGLRHAWRAAFKGAVKENLEELPDELLSQISTALAKDPEADITAIIGDFIQRAPELMTAVALLGGMGQAGAALHPAGTLTTAQPPPLPPPLPVVPPPLNAQQQEQTASDPDPEAASNAEPPPGPQNEPPTTPPRTVGDEATQADQAAASELDTPSATDNNEFAQVGTPPLPPETAQQVAQREARQSQYD